MRQPPEVQSFSMAAIVRAHGVTEPRYCSGVLVVPLVRRGLVPKVVPRPAASAPTRADRTLVCASPWTLSPLVPDPPAKVRHDMAVIALLGLTCPLQARRNRRPRLAARRRANQGAGDRDCASDHCDHQLEDPNHNGHDDTHVCPVSEGAVTILRSSPKKYSTSNSTASSAKRVSRAPAGLGIHSADRTVAQ